MPSIIEQLAGLFRKFPGIGSRQTKRFVYFLLQQDETYVQELISTIIKVRKHTHLCKESFQYFISDNNEILSPIVRDENRNKKILMVVLKDIDIEMIEKSHVYMGQYFVLGNFVPIIETRIYDDNVRLPQLLNLIEQRATNDNLQEIILAFPLNTEGEHTRRYIQTRIEPIVNKYKIKISTLGRGLSTGTELEYIDNDTFTSAFETRK